MQSSDGAILTFGVMDAAIAYTPRPAAYAVIADERGRIAVVKGARGYFLPGGGSLAGETPEQTVRREVREELGREVAILGQIGKAIQYFYADEQDYRMQAHFFVAEFVDEVIGGGEEDLHWLEAGSIGEVLYHESHAWAVNQGRGATSSKAV